jgi:hypothetical protein
MGTAVSRRVYPAIARRPGLDRATLEREYLAQNRPVVIPGAAGEWHSRWSPDALAARFGESPLEVEETRIVYVGERTQRPRPLGEVVGKILADDPELRWKGLEFLTKVPAMRADLTASPAPTRSLLPSSAHGFRDTLWIAPRATTSSLHHDGNFDNVNLQISGRKLFLLIRPPSRRALHAYGSAESPINPFAPEEARFPRFRQSRPVEATLHPGDALLIPKYWWHCVYAFEPSVNLSTHFSWDAEPSAWRVLAGTPLVHRTLTVAAAALKRHGLRRVADVSRRAWYACYTRVVPRVEPQARCELHDDAVGGDPHGVAHC